MVYKGPTERIDGNAVILKEDIVEEKGETKTKTKKKLKERRLMVKNLFVNF